jgi:hypothetical protein
MLCRKEVGCADKGVDGGVREGVILGLLFKLEKLVELDSRCRLLNPTLCKAREAAMEELECLSRVERWLYIMSNQIDYCETRVSLRRTSQRDCNLSGSAGRIAENRIGDLSDAVAKS